jgi:hypothetical protein
MIAGAGPWSGDPHPAGGCGPPWRILGIIDADVGWLVRRER